MQANTIHCGNHRDILKEYPDGFFDMFLTSPPYDNLRDYEGYDFQFEPLAHELYRVLKDCGVGVWIVSDATVNGSETLTSFKQAIYFKEECGFKVYDTMIYEKKNPIPSSNNRYQQSFEYMFVMSKGGLNVANLIKRELSESTKERSKYATNSGFRKKSSGFNVRSSYAQNEPVLKNVWTYKVGTGNTTKDKIAFEHPAIFPEKLAEDHILSWSNPGDIILDPMAGSFTTCKMAVKHGRQYVGIDISEKYCEIGRQRIEKFTAQSDMFGGLGYNKHLQPDQNRAEQISML